MKITREEYPTLFEDILEYETDVSYNDHRKNSNFFKKSIITFTRDLLNDLNIKNESLIGNWETNTYIYDDNYGTDLNEITELIQVKPVDLEVMKLHWVPIEE